MSFSSEKGYSIIETLIVLTMTTILLGVTIFSFQPLQRSLQKKIFISQLQADLYFLQSFAINQKQTSILEFGNRNGYYQGASITGEVLFYRKLPEYVTQVQNERLFRVIINPNGNTDRFGDLYFIVHGKEIKLRFHIGQGRFYVYE
ncbi:competence protein ComGD [Bacillus pakistanensis]|uniref:Competence protein ComGD n=1 Tax=Rossellomorea pakistanensis TaxID=992288 RepID=A0ABS2N9T4_9BACI|nr:competence type IV pilus minor pilin ComGD [Bacillus pakistanensis]MBM7584607.1 competence protein ComGD [Bacillus pakistanensis]